MPVVDQLLRNVSGVLLSGYTILMFKYVNMYGIWQNLKGPKSVEVTASHVCVHLYICGNECGLLFIMMSLCFWKYTSFWELWITINLALGKINRQEAKGGIVFDLWVELSWLLFYFTIMRFLWIVSLASTCVLLSLLQLFSKYKHGQDNRSKCEMLCL